VAKICKAPKVPTVSAHDMRDLHGTIVIPEKQVPYLFPLGKLKQVDS